MKNFLKIVGASCLGFALFSIVAFIGLIVLMVGAAGQISNSLGNQSETASNEKSVLYLPLKGVLDERSQQTFYQMLGREDLDNDYSCGLDDLLKAIEGAREDPNIKGIYLQPGAFSASPAALQELRNALANFQKGGKWVYAYSGAYTQGCYYLSSVADSLFLNPQGVIDFRGLAYHATFYKRLLEKVGVEMQVVKVGTFKSYTEQFSNTQMSDANRLQSTAMVQSIWNNMLTDISASRKISVQKLNQIADSLQDFRPATGAIKTHLADALTYRDGALNKIRQRLGMDKDEDISFIDFRKYANGLTASQKGDEVALLYAVGEIDNGNSNGINSQTLIKQINQLAKDDQVKAVVLRVNSPGGSAYGSEQIWHALMQLKQKKPLVVSMGSYAASGGYYISCCANKIVAESNTLTGSIGIFGVIPNIEKLANKLGVDYDVTTTNANSNMPAVFRQMTPEQMRLVQLYVSNGYHLFVQRCADGRHLPAAQIEKIAQGRVWTGEAALKNGLIDQIGHLNDATSLAAQLAKVKSYHVTEYPEKKDPFESFLGSPSLGIKALLMPKLLSNEKQLLQKTKNIDLMQAALPYTINIY